MVRLRSDRPDPSSDPRPSPVRDGVAIGIATGVVGVAFGVLARGEGLSVAQACAMSLLVFTGASQLAAVSIVGAGGSALAAAVSALLLAGRNALYGPVVAPWLEADRPTTRAVAAQLIIDESAGVGAAQPDPAQRRRGFWAAGLGVYVCWNLGTAVGAVAGGALGDLDAWGLDAAFPAAFIALLAPHLGRPSGRTAAAVAGVVAVAAVAVVPTGLPVVLGTVGAAAGALHAARAATSAPDPAEEGLP